MTTRVRRSASVAAVAWLAAAFAGAAGAQEPPRPAVEGNDWRDIACSPHASILPPAPTLHVLAGQEERQSLFGIGETVILSAGTVQGVRVGQEYFVRRVVHDQFALPVAGYQPVSIHTAGWVRVLAVHGDTAFATITDACDGVMVGDYLEPFARPAAPPTAAAAAGQPDYAGAGVIVLGDERRQLGGAGMTMVVDRGTYHGVRPGQRGTIFRVALGGAGPVVRVGEATAVAVDRDTSVIRIDRSRDAVMVGDRVALHK